ncbi:unnamed protein product [Paramecium pentaurelia]|uniref:CSC1/OSCA1-like cytosolic domain-containing protein n=1 Tax=Paramecium pentaurelia TaxID=43138 RepID=A0A8S1TBQ7_9CILI|nr:unnamed protein product [Paramecium pentaurelia]
MSKIVPLPIKSSAIVIKELQDDIRPSDPIKANEYILQNMFFKQDETGQLTPYEFTVGLDEFKKHGLGLYLYFKFLEYAIYVFFIMSIIASVICYFNSTGNGLDAWKNLNLLQKLSVGNQNKIESSSGTTYTTSDIQQFYTDSSMWLSTLTWMDFSYTLIFILFYLGFTYWSNKSISESLVKEKVPANFSIGIKGLREDERDPNKLKNFIEDLGFKVKEVKYAKNYSNTLLLHKQEAELKIKLKGEEIKARYPDYDPKIKQKYLKELQEIQAERETIIKNTIGKRLKHDEYPTLMAFVIFQRIGDKNMFIKEYKTNTNFNFFQTLCCGKKVEDKYLYKGNVLKIIPQVDNPSNINWENLEVSSSNRFLRQIIVGLGVFCLMIITFFIVFAINVVSKYSPEDCEIRDYTYENTQQWISQASTASEKSQIQQCFCMNLSLTTLYADYFDYCSDIIYQYTGIQALQIASAFVILIVNSLLQLLIKSIVTFERYQSLSKKLSGTLTKLFISLFVNTALITLILKANIYGFKLSYYLSSPIPPLQSAQQKEVFPSDFNREWYAVVGAAYVNTWIINIFSPYFIDFVLYPIKNWFRKREAANAKIQRDLNKLSVGPEFDLDLYYANLLNTIFVTLFYCSLIPLMLPLGFLALLIHFLVQKFLLLKFYRKPPSYDEALHDSVFTLLPYSIIMHILIAIWAYGHPYIFPSSSDALIDNEGFLDVSKDSVWIRISNSSQISILGVIFVIILIIKYFFINPLQYLVKVCCDSEAVVVDFAQEETYDQIYDQISSVQLATYEIRENENYKDLVYSLDSDHRSPTQRKSEEERVPLQDI